MTGTPINLGESIRKVRAIEEKMEAMEKAFKEKMKPFKEYAEGKRAEILQYLLATGQKSANTEFGGCHWKEKVTYRVEDREEFQRHVIGMEAWGLVTWGAAGIAAEAFTKEHSVPPPGCVRNAVILPYITPPTKPRIVKGGDKSSSAEPVEQEPEGVE